MSITAEINYKETPPTKKYRITLDETEASALRVHGCFVTAERPSLHTALYDAGVGVTLSPGRSPKFGEVEAVEIPGERTPDTVTLAMTYRDALVLRDLLIDRVTWHSDNEYGDVARATYFALTDAGVGA